MKIAYTVGPMRAFTIDGIHYHWTKNIEIGKCAHDAALRAGWFSVCPHLLSGHGYSHEILEPQEYLDRDLEFIRMVRPDIILLPRWVGSEGAKAEYYLAVELGLNLYYYDEDGDAIRPDVVVGAGNVFADLDVPNAGDMLVKAGLLSQVNDAIHSKGLSVQKAATLLGTGSNDLLPLLRGITISTPKESSSLAETSGSFHGSSIYSQAQLQLYLDVLTHEE